VDEDRQGDRLGRKRWNPAGVVVVSGLFGLAAAAMMYYDASSQGKAYLEDSLWIIVAATVLGAISLVIGVYLYMKHERE